MDALARLKSQVREAEEAGDGVIAVSFDIANAFNTIPHSTIKKVLRYHGVPLYMRRLLRSYLADREVLLVNRMGALRWNRAESGVP